MAENDAVLMRQLHDEHAAALWRHCLRLTNYDRERAEDLAQETLLRAWRNPRLLNGNPGAIRSWLYTVSRNIVIDQWRSRRARPEVLVEEVPEQGSASDRTDELLLSWVVAEALTKLSPDHREVLLECYFRAQPVAAAAEHLGIPVGTVKSRAHYALRALRLALEELGVVG